MFMDNVCRPPIILTLDALPTDSAAQSNHASESAYCDRTFNQKCSDGGELQTTAKPDHGKHAVRVDAGSACSVAMASSYF